MTKAEPAELSPELALARAQEAAETGVLAQLGVRISTPEEISLRLAQRLVDATTVDDLLAENATSGWAEHEGRSVLIRHVDYAPSTKKAGLPFYAIVDAVDVDTGEHLMLTTGGQNTVVQLAKMVRMDLLETPVKLRVDTTAEGNSIHRLVKGDPGSNTPF